MIYVDRNGNRTEGTTGQDRLLKFIYTHTATRLLIRPFLSPWVSKLGGTFLSTRLLQWQSVHLLKRIRSISVNMKSRSLLLIMNFHKKDQSRRTSGGNG